MTECEVTVKRLRELYHSGKYNIEIETPDGYQPIGKWFDKGELEMVRVKTHSFVTECAVNHLIQDWGGRWVLAGELEPGVEIQTRTGPETVQSVESINRAECYDWEVLHPNHRYYGDGIVSHNSGKSYIAAGNLVRNAQRQGIFVVLLDSENALDEKWLQAVGVDTSEDKLLRIGVSMIDDVARILSDFVKEYKSDYGHLDEDARPKVMFVVDSLGMLLTPTDVAQFEKGDMKGDLGRKAKSLTALVRNAVNQIARWEIGLVCTNHTYASQDMFNPDDVVAGGCLTADHRVWMHDGTLKAIQDIEVGDTVQTLEGHAEVEERFHFDDKEVFELELETGEIIQATGEHRFLVEVDAGETAWKRVDELDPEDEILKWT